MRTIGSPTELERRRRLAVCRLSEGYPPEEVADFLGVAPRSGRRWAAASRDADGDGLAARAATGRPPKLTAAQEAEVLGRLAGPATAHGFANDLWTAGRVARRARQRWDVGFNRRYLSSWLRARGGTPQRPRRVPRERDQAAVDRWLAEDRPRIQKRCGGGGPGGSWPTRAGCCWPRCCAARWPPGAGRRR